MTGPSYHGRTHLPGGTDPIPGVLKPNLICDDVTGGGFQFDWTNYTAVSGTSFAADSVSLAQAASGTGPYYQPTTASMPPLITDEWVEFSFRISVNTTSGYSSYANTVAAIKGVAVASGDSNALCELQPSNQGSALHFLFGTVLAQDPGPGAYANNLATTGVSITANQVYDIGMFARVTANWIYSKVIIDEVEFLNQKIANPAVASGGLHETYVELPRWGLNSVGTGTTPTWTFDSFRYAIKSTDRRPCVDIVSPYT